MSTHSSYATYGIPVELPGPLPWWDFFKAKPQGGRVLPMGAGAYDDDQFYLVIPETWREVEPGNRVSIAPYLASEEPYLSWDGLLVAAAEELKLVIVDPPAWIFAPDES